MCLTSKIKVPSIASEDIICYKVLCYETKASCYTTPYQRASVTLNQMFIAKESEKIISFYKDYYIIDKGFIHAYLDKERAIKLAKDFTEESLIDRTLFVKGFVVKAIIKKGTQYYHGICGDVCATKIFITDEEII